MLCWHLNKNVIWFEKYMIDKSSKKVYDTEIPIKIIKFKFEVLWVMIVHKIIHLVVLSSPWK